LAAKAGRTSVINVTYINGHTLAWLPSSRRVASMNSFAASDPPLATATAPMIVAQIF